jgi:hypothetical protein
MFVEASLAQSISIKALGMLNQGRGEYIELRVFCSDQKDPNTLPTRNEWRVGQCLSLYSISQRKFTSCRSMFFVNASFANLEVFGMVSSPVQAHLLHLKFWIVLSHSVD